MKKLILPKLKITNTNNSLPKKNHLYSNPFASMLKKYKLKRPSLVKPESKENETKYMLTESNKNFNDTITNLLQKEENTLLIKGQKYLINLMYAKNS